MKEVAKAKASEETYGSSLSPWTPTVPFSTSTLRSTEDRLSAMVLLLELMVWG